MTRAWLRYAGHTNGLPPEALIRSIANYDITLYEPDPDSERGLGILVVNDFNTALCESLSKLAFGGRARVLVLADSAVSLAGENTWRLLRAGASDVLAWGRSPDSAAAIAARLTRWNTVDQIVASPAVRETMVGQSAALTAVLRQIVELGKFSNASILIGGESGTGKELAARLIHALDPRPNKRELVVLDCTTIVPELAGSEFFGHERGAFTGAVAARDGAFFLADGGTLFLDEVGDLPRSLQAQLLRVIQEHTFKRVGANAWNETHFRLLCATNKNLPEEVMRGSFRADLFYRIVECTITLPALHERRDDIPLLARHFIGAAASSHELDPAVQYYLATRDYPGNVRELKQVVGRMIHRHVGPGAFTVGDLPSEDRPLEGRSAKAWHDSLFEQAVRQAVASDVGLKEIGRLAEAAALRIALADAGGNLQHAARRLKVTDRALQLRRANGRADETPSISEKTE
jgi:transcriptional regulator with GAF, ATPase, and Fis domain